MVAIATEFASPRKSCSPKTPIRDQVQLSGLRYYNPEMGRWLNRDPLGDRSRVRLYPFVSNNPIGFVDPVGLYKLDLNPQDVADVKGWPYKYVQTSAFWGRAMPEDDVSCECDAGCLSMTCTIKVHYGAIEISDIFKDGKTVTVTKTYDNGGTHTRFVTAKNTYGHEQLHMTSYIEAIKSEDPTAFFDAVREAEAVTYADLTACEEVAKEKSREFTRRLDTEVYPGHDTSRGGPEKHGDYYPIDGVFPALPGPEKERE